MEKRHERRPVHIHFTSNKEAVDLFIRIELKYFLMKLLYRKIDN